MFRLSTVVAPTSLDELVKEFERAFKFCTSLELDGVELSIPNPWKVNGKILKKIVDSYGLKVSAISTGLGNVWYGWSLSSKNVELRKNAINAIKKHIDEAVHLEAPVIIGLIRGLGESPLNNSLSRFKESLIECVKHAELHDVTLLLEPINRYETKLINKIKEAKRVIKEINSKNLKLMVDTYHMNVEESSIGASLIEGKDLLAYVHIADSNRLAPGYGHIDFKDFLTLLKSIGYDGYLSLEILSIPNFEKAVKTGVDYLRMIMRFLE